MQVSHRLFFYRTLVTRNVDSGKERTFGLSIVSSTNVSPSRSIDVISLSSAEMRNKITNHQASVGCADL